MNRKCGGSFFMPKFKHKGGNFMIKEEIMENYYSNKHTQNIPVIFVCECFTAIERVLEEIRKENPYASVSELFDE